MKSIRAIVTFMALIIIMAACQKDEGSTSKDYSSLFKNTVWTGEYNINGKTIQPVSIFFNENGSFTWLSLTQNPDGLWELYQDILTLNLSKGGFKAKITNDNKLSNIEIIGTNGWELNNLELNTIPDDVLDNTTWITENLIIEFLKSTDIQPTSPDSVKVRVGGLQYPAIHYSKQYKTIRINYSNYRFFLVRESSNLFKGANSIGGDNSIYPFEVTKQ